MTDSTLIWTHPKLRHLTPDDKRVQNMRLFCDADQAAGQRITDSKSYPARYRIHLVINPNTAGVVLVWAPMPSVSRTAH